MDIVYVRPFISLFAKHLYKYEVTYNGSWKRMDFVFLQSFIYFEAVHLVKSNHTKLVIQYSNSTTLVKTCHTIMLLAYLGWKKTPSNERCLILWRKKATSDWWGRISKSLKLSVKKFHNFTKFLQTILLICILLSVTNLWTCFNLTFVGELFNYIA